MGAVETSIRLLNKSTLCSSLKKSMLSFLVNRFLFEWCLNKETDRWLRSLTRLQESRGHIT